MDDRLFIARAPGWVVMAVLWALVPAHFIAAGLVFDFVPADMPDAVEQYAVLGWLTAQLIALEVLAELVVRKWPHRRRRGECPPCIRPRPAQHLRWHWKDHDPS